ncbi:glycosyltransferase [Anaerobacillus alkaliphilus]|uniref:Glycosyltransferase n=1 Tax=Anaerobacillus alkaliphilus TaxID=1548597 RepID=A0A4Q0VX86_9BACI|nr:glycosyltransferase [Anaerobacillus alkaliphilus]RXJ02255.1 glycosyltransferase [Anaerobacillus alkaliphilus]
MGPKITVLMSVYNEEKYLRESIESILNQTYSDFEFLIFDDASNDGSKAILKEYQKKDSRINLVLNETNRGLSYNLAEGVLISKGNWIARMDADDIAFKNRLELQLDYIKNNPEIDVLGSYVLDINEKGNEIELRKLPTSHKEIKSLIWTCPFIHPSVMFRRDAIIKAGSYNRNLRRRQDYDLWFRCCAAHLKFANMDTPIIYYRCTNEYFRKNDFKVQVNQAIMGYKGARLVEASPVAYLGITVAFLKGILPTTLRRPVSRALKKFDPRRR